MATKRKWADRLAAAIKRGKFTEQDMNMADDWTRCAVGEQPRGITGIQLNIMPPDFDYLLEEYGCDFSNHVERNEIGEAVTSYLAVQGRIRELKVQKAA